MKITELKCPGCGAVFEVKDEKANIVQCEYCGGKFSLEWENQNTPNRTANVKPIEEIKRIDYTPIKFEEEPSKPVSPLTRIWIAIAVLAILGTGAYLFSSTKKADPEKPASVTRNPLATITGADAAKKTPYGLLADTLGAIFHKPAAEVTAEEIAEIKWLTIGLDTDASYKIGYSFDNPIDSPEAELAWLKFPCTNYQDNSFDCLPAFTGLKMLSTTQPLKKSHLEGLSLQGIKGSYKSLEQIAELIDPKLLHRIELTSSTDLTGLGLFPNLETLVIVGKEITNQKLLTNTPIKSLSLNLSGETFDFSVLGTMPALEELSINCKSLKDINFVTKINGLKKLTLERCAILTLAPLENAAGLTALSVTNCSDVKDLSAVSTLTGLTSLQLSLPYKCPQPTLDGLTNLTRLSLTGFDNTSFLKNMPKLERLEFQNCTAGGADDFSNLNNLKYLRFSASGLQTQDFSFLSGLTTLEVLDLHGMSIYSDISGVFHLKNLKELNLNSASCEIDFDKITENTSLEILSMDKIKLFENVYIRQYGGVTDIYYDDVSLLDHLDFFQKLKGIKKLSICKNELTSVSFAGLLSTLQSIDFSDNYVTDLSPLAGLKDLQQVTCTDNPVTNYEVLNDGVTVIH